MKLSEAISLRVIKLLEKNRLKQYDLHKKGGIAKSTISDLVNNNKNRVSVLTIYQICSTLGITLKNFFSDALFNELDD